MAPFQGLLSAPGPYKGSFDEKFEAKGLCYLIQMRLMGVKVELCSLIFGFSCPEQNDQLKRLRAEVRREGAMKGGAMEGGGHGGRRPWRIPRA